MAVTAEYRAAGSLPPTSVAPPTQSTRLGASHGGAPTGENRDRNRSNEDEAAAAAARSYTCRFCQETFTKSQALGGHMNRHRQERQTELYGNALNILQSREAGQYPSNFGRSSQLPQQFAANPTLASFSANLLLQSQLRAFQAQQEPYNHIPYPFHGNLGHPEGNLYGDLNAANIQNRPLHANRTNIPHGSQVWNESDILLMAAYNMRNEDLQPHHQPQLLHSDPNSGMGASMQGNHPYSFGQGMSPSSSSSVAVTEGNQDPLLHHQPQLLGSDPNSGVGTSMQRNYAYSFEQGMPLASSSTPSVTQGRFSPSIQSQHDNFGMGTSDQSGGLLSNSPAHQTERAASPNFTMPPLISQYLANQSSYFASDVSPMLDALEEYQNMQLPTYISSQNPTLPLNSQVNEESRLANVSGNLRGLTPPSQFEAATRNNFQDDTNVEARRSNSDFINSDSSLISNSYIYGSSIRRD